jgi:RHH-type proline utilization regulon transcriptional repressor/proline dehydrogenase/delta 1-pyrroline-5-carboxylate dehydrogenase
VRLATRDQDTSARIEAAGLKTGVEYSISIATEESDDAFIAQLPKLAQNFEFLRTVDGAPDRVLAAAHGAGLNWIDAPVTACGRVELRYWLREQAVSTTMHRYGQLKKAN